MQRRLLEGLLRESVRPAFETVSADTLGAGLARIAEGGIDVVLLDLVLPDSQELDTFVRVHSAAPDVPIVVEDRVGRGQCAGRNFRRLLRRRSWRPSLAS